MTNDALAAGKLFAAVGTGRNNAKRDVMKVQARLAELGYLDTKRTDGPTGFFGSREEDAVKKFQADEGLSDDGRINPDGETIVSLFGPTKAKLDSDANNKKTPEEQWPGDTDADQICREIAGRINRLQDKIDAKKAEIKSVETRLTEMDSEGLLDEIKQKTVSLIPGFAGVVAQAVMSGALRREAERKKRKYKPGSTNYSNLATLIEIIDKAQQLYRNHQTGSVLVAEMNRLHAELEVVLTEMGEAQIQRARNYCYSLAS